MLSQDVDRDDKAALYPSWINRALRKIQQDNSWRCMRASADVTITSGTSLVDLPANMKELTPEKSPVFVRDVDNATSLYPAVVQSKEHILAYKVTNLYPASTTNISGLSQGLEVWVEMDATGQWSLHVPENATQDLGFVVTYFGFLAALVDDADSNFLTTEYEDMVEAKCKQVAFAAIADPLSADFEVLYREFLRQAKADDSRRQHRGRKLRMGG